MNFNDLLIKERINPQPVLVLRHRPHEPEWNLPLAKQAKRIKQKISSPESYWEGHRVGCRKEYCHLEQVVGLHQLPAQGFKVMAMPLPLNGCSASPVRLVAIIGE